MSFSKQGMWVYIQYSSSKYVGIQFLVLSKPIGVFSLGNSVFSTIKLYEFKESNDWGRYSMLVRE